MEEETDAKYGFIIVGYLVTVLVMKCIISSVCSLRNKYV